MLFFLKKKKLQNLSQQPQFKMKKKKLSKIKEINEKKLFPLIQCECVFLL